MSITNEAPNALVISKLRVKDMDSATTHTFAGFLELLGATPDLAGE